MSSQRPLVGKRAAAPLPGFQREGGTYARKLDAAGIIVVATLQVETESITDDEQFPQAAE